MKYRKIILLIVFIFFLSSCTNISNQTYDELINEITNIKKNVNTHNKGFSFYTPKNVLIDKSGTNFVIFNDNENTYYLYIDLVSYNNKTENKYETKSGYYKSLEKGYISINNWENNQYLIEIVNNYAKIEVKVDENDVKHCLINALNIVNSVDYNDVIIEKLLNDDNLSFTEEKFETFKEPMDTEDSYIN